MEVVAGAHRQVRVSIVVAEGIWCEEYRAGRTAHPSERRAKGGPAIKAIVDTDLCIGCELCADTCPEIFAVWDDGYAHVIAEPIPHEEYDCVQEAAEICPVTAITTTAD